MDLRVIVKSRVHLRVWGSVRISSLNSTKKPGNRRGRPLGKLTTWKDRIISLLCCSLYVCCCRVPKPGHLDIRLVPITSFTLCYSYFLVRKHSCYVRELL